MPKSRTSNGPRKEFVAPSDGLQLPFVSQRIRAWGRTGWTCGSTCQHKCELDSGIGLAELCSAPIVKYESQMEYLWDGLDKSVHIPVWAATRTGLVVVIEVHSD